MLLPRVKIAERQDEFFIYMLKDYSTEMLRERWSAETKEAGEMHEYFVLAYTIISWTHIKGISLKKRPIYKRNLMYEKIQFRNKWSF